MDRSSLARRVTPAGVFVVVLAAIVALSLRGGGTTLEPVPLGSSGVRNDRAKTAGADSAAPALAPYYGKVVIPDALLAGLPDEGPVYQVGATVGADRVAALATALGVSGEPRTDDDGWVVGPGNVAVDGGVVSSGGVSTGVATAEPGTVEPSPNASGAPDEPVPPPCPSPAPDTKDTCVTPLPPVPVSPPPGPSDDAARAAAAKVFAAVGLGDAPVAVTDGWGSKDVAASPVVGGLPTVGFETRVNVDADGTIAYANGFLGTPHFDARYPLLDPRAAVDRGYGSGIEPMRDLIGAPCEVGSTCPPYPAAPDREATKVRLGLLFMGGWDGKDAFLAPAWLLSFEGSTYEEPVLALPDKYIATPPPSGDPGEPVCNPSPCPKPGVEEGTAVPPADGNR